MIRIICEWCGTIIAGRRKKFCSRVCQCNYYNQNRTEDTLRKIGEGNRGKVRTEESRRKQSDSVSGELNHNYGKPLSESTKAKMRGPRPHTQGTNHYRYGTHLSDEQKSRISETRKTTMSNYEFTEDSLESSPYYRRLAIETYGYQCCVCGECDRTKVLHVHHIDGNHSNDDISNLVVLCPTCHNRAHYVVDGHGRLLAGRLLNEDFKKLLLEIINKEV